MGDRPRLRPLSPETATDKVYDSLYKAIVSFELPPGSKVSETEIAGLLGVSRQPVRDAFFRLSDQGLLSIRPQRATLITRISVKAVRQAVFTRTALELACIRVLINQKQANHTKILRIMLEDQHEAVRRDDQTGFHDLDEAFHKHICDLSDQTHVWPLILEQKAHMDRARYLFLPGTARKAHQEHVQLVDAMDAENLDEAVLVMEQHLGYIASQVQQMSKAQAHFFSED